MSSHAGPVLAIDLGGTKALIGVVEPDGTVRFRLPLTTRDLNGRPSAMLDRIADGGGRALDAACVRLDQVAAIGVCLPGILNADRSVIVLAPNLGWVDVAVRAQLEQRFGTAPVFVENDVRTAALGELRFGAGRGYSSLLAVFVGSGVGGGIVIDDQPFRGAHGLAGEVGHMVIVAGGPRCGCGRSGCLESLAGREAVARSVRKDVQRGHATVLADILKGDLMSMTSRDLAQALSEADPVALRAARRSARYVGLAIGGLINVLDPDVVVVGGGIAEAVGTRYVRWAAEIACRQALPSPGRNVPIVASQLGDDAGLLGAALAARAGLEASAPR
jgi:glucokinase